MGTKSKKPRPSKRGDKWTVSIRDTEYDIVSRSTAEVSELENAEGIFVSTLGTIVINNNLAPSRIPAVLAHEIGHACFFESGGEYMLTQMLGDKLSADVQEMILQTVMPLFLGTMRKLTAK